MLSFPIDGDGPSGRQSDPGDTVPSVGADATAAAARRHRDLPRGGGRATRPSTPGTYDDELALLVVHGLLHLLGMDHADDDEPGAMQARERELLGAVPRPAGPRSVGRP